jgi:signal transduction histidine kinase
MSNAVSRWSFNRERQFHHLCGDSAVLFQQAPEELLFGDVSMVDDPEGSWAARLDRLFSGATCLEQWTVAVEDANYTLVHVPVRAKDGAVMFVAGFAYRDGQEIPASLELELAARAASQALETERKQTARFLHDVVAQSLSSTGLQLELLRLELEAGSHEVRGPITDIQRRLDETLKQVRAFSGEPDLHSG